MSFFDEEDEGRGELARYARARPPRGNGTNVHLKEGGIVFAQENYSEVHGIWHSQRQRQGLLRLTGREGKRVSIPSEDIAKLEEL